MTETMLEKAARAHFDDHYKGAQGGWLKETVFGRSDITFDEIMQGIHEGVIRAIGVRPHFEAARAVLLAIREPDEAMRRAIGHVDIDVACGEHNETMHLTHWPEEDISEVDEVWRAGIDAILQEKPQK